MERLDAAGRHPENQDPTKQFAIQQAKRLLREARVKDPGLKHDKLSNATNPKIHDKDHLTQAIEVYKNQPLIRHTLTPQRVNLWIKSQKTEGKY